MKKISVILALLLLGVWFTGCSEESATSPEDQLNNTLQKANVSINTWNGSGDETSCVTLYAGQHIDAGEVCFEVVGDDFCVTYATTGGWELDEYHLWVGTDLAKMPQTKKGSPKLGKFLYKDEGLSGGASPVTSVTVCIPAGDLVEGELCPNDLKVVAHAVVKKDTDGDGTLDAEETAYADGEDLGNSWAMGVDVPIYTVVITEPCFDPEGLESELEEAAAGGANDGVVGLKVFHQGGNAGQPYFRGDLDYDQDGTSEQTGLPFYCVDLANTIYSNRPYCALMLSSYSTNLPEGIINPQNLDLANYVLNNYSIGDNIGNATNVTGGDIQRVLWKLVYGTLPGPGAYSSGPSSNANVDDILDDVYENGESYTPSCDGVVAVILYPVNCTPGDILAQALIAQVLVTEFPTTCGECVVGSYCSTVNPDE